MRGTVLLCVVAVVAVVVLGTAAYLNDWPPFQPDSQTAASCAGACSAPGQDSATAGRGPAVCHAYSVFLDPTSSTRDRANYAPEMGKFLGRLHECDSVKVGRIADRTADEAAVLPWTELPQHDPDAGGGDDATFKEKYQKAKRSIEMAVNGLLQEESPANSTDILGLFSRLSADPDKENVVVIFSDGLDSDTIEKTCITPQSIQGLLDKAAGRLRGHSTSLDGFDEVFWVVSTRAGQAGCNSLREQRSFWPVILGAESGPSKPAIHFDTNPF